jgi:hypothetical protein
MKAFYKQDNKASYLDVTEFILKECSPLMKASSPKLIFNDQVRNYFMLAYIK